MVCGTLFQNDLKFSLQIMLKLLIRSKDSCQTGVLIPVPTYASFTLALEEQGAAIIPYHLCEEQGWTLQVEELRKALHTGRKTCNPVALYICNPGNPTGTVRNYPHYCKKSMQSNLAKTCLPSLSCLKTYIILYILLLP